MGYKAYGCGGGSGGCGNFYIYDLSDNNWITKTSRSYNINAACGHGGAYDDVYIWGGKSPNQYKCTKWDVAGESWSDKTEMGHTVDYGHFPTFGGYMWTAKGIKWDYVNEVWKGCISYFQSSMACFEIDSNLYMAGNNTENYPNCYKFTTATEVWSRIADKPVYSYDNMRSGAGDGTYGFVWAGGSPARETWYGQTERYDTGSDSWVTRGGTCSAYYQRSGCRIDDKIYTIGGFKQVPATYTNSHQEYSNATDVWASKISYPLSDQLFIEVAPPVNKPPSAPTGLSVSAT